MRRLLLLFPLVFGFSSGNLLNGGRFLETERLDDKHRTGTTKLSYLYTALEDGLKTIIGRTIGNTFLSDQEMIRKLDDEWVKKGTEEFYAVLEVRDIVKKLDKWIENQGWTTNDTFKNTPKTVYVRKYALEAMEKRMVCNRYEGALGYVSDAVGKDIYEKSFKPEIQSLIDDVYFDCSKMIAIVGKWLTSLTKEPPHTRVDKLFRNFEDVRNPLYTEMFDYAVERDYLNEIKGEYSVQTIKAFQIYYELRTQTKLYGDGEYLNVTSRLRTFERSYYKTIPREISEQFEHIYARIAENRHQNNETRTKALLVVKQIPAITTESEKFAYFRKTFPDADDLAAGQYLSWVKIYNDLEKDYGSTCSVSILNEFRALLLRYIYNAIHGVLNAEQQEQEFDLLVRVIHDERGKHSAKIVHQLMKEIQEKKIELFKEVKANAVLSTIMDVVYSNNTLTDKIKKLGSEFENDDSGINKVIGIVLPLLYTEEYKDVLGVRYGENLTEAMIAIEKLILAGVIFDEYQAFGANNVTNKHLELAMKEAEDNFGQEKIDEFSKDVMDSVQLDFGGPREAPINEDTSAMNQKTPLGFEEHPYFYGSEHHDTIQKTVKRPLKSSRSRFGYAN